MGSQRGMSLIELMVTLTILALLAASAMQAFGTYRKSGQEATAIHYMRSWVPAQELYLQTYNHYADADEQLGSAGFRILRVPTKIPYNFSIDSTGIETERWWGRGTPTKPGYRFFYVDQSGVVRSSSSGPISP